MKQYLPVRFVGMGFAMCCESGVEQSRAESKYLYDEAWASKKRTWCERMPAHYGRGLWSLCSSCILRTQVPENQCIAPFKSSPLIFFLFYFLFTY